MRIGPVVLAAGLLLLGAGCAPASTTTAGGPSVASTPTEPPPAPASASAPAVPTATEPAVPQPATTGPTTPAPPAAAPPPPVPIAIITSFTANSVSWTDGKLVPAQYNDSEVDALTGAGHQHTAPLSPNIRYYTFQGPDGVALDDNANGTVPCSRQDEAALVLNDVNLSPRLTFDSQGRVLTMAARFHP